MVVIGSRAQVMHGTAERTSGGLKKKDLKYKKGRIISRKASRSAKKSNNLVNAGWTFNKGEFGAVRIDDAPNKKSKNSKNSKNNKKRRGK